MFRPLAVYIGLRYTQARRRNGFISFIALTSVLGLALGVAALITVLSVMNGFEHELRARILGMTAHATVVAPGGALHQWPAVVAAVGDDPHVLGAAPFVRGEGMLTHFGVVQGTVVRGVLPDMERRVSRVGRHMVAGSLDDLAPGSWRIVLGAELARSLGAAPGDRVTLVTPEATASPVGMVPRLRRFTVAGIFEVGMHEYDSALALIHLADAQALFRLGDAVSGVRLELDDVFRAPQIARRIVREVLEPRFRRAYAVIDWTQYHTNFFRALKTEKRVMFVILSLIIAVAAFNIVSALVMVVADKRPEVAIMRTIGLTPRTVVAIFVVQGVVIGLAGTLLGVAGGTWLATHVETLVPAIERLFHVQFLPADVYYISELPSELRLRDVATVGAVAFVLSTLATLYPAWRAGRTEPAEALRHE